MCLWINKRTQMQKSHHALRNPLFFIHFRHILSMVLVIKALTLSCSKESSVCLRRSIQLLLPQHHLCLRPFSFGLGCCRSTYRSWLPEGRELFIEHLLPQSSQRRGSILTGLPSPVLPAGISGCTISPVWYSVHLWLKIPLQLFSLWEGFYMYCTWVHFKLLY